MDQREQEPAIFSLQVEELLDGAEGVPAMILRLETEALFAEFETGSTKFWDSRCVADRAAWRAALVRPRLHVEVGRDDLTLKELSQHQQPAVAFWHCRKRWAR